MNAVHGGWDGLSFFANITQWNGFAKDGRQREDDPSEWAIITVRVTRCPLMRRLGLHATLHREGGIREKERGRKQMDK